MMKNHSRDSDQYLQVSQHLATAQTAQALHMSAVGIDLNVAPD